MLFVYDLSVSKVNNTSVVTCDQLLKKWNKCFNKYYITRVNMDFKIDRNK